MNILNCFWSVISKIGDIVTIVAGIVSLFFIPDIVRFFTRKIKVINQNYFTSQSSNQSEYENLINTVKAVFTELKSHDGCNREDLYSLISPFDSIKFNSAIDELIERVLVYISGNKTLHLTKKAKRIKI